jgi:HEAT repeat protein
MEERVMSDINIIGTVMALPLWIQAAVALGFLLLVLLVWFLAVRLKRSRLQGNVAGEKLIDHFSHHPGRGAALKILSDYPDQGLFAVFLGALKKKVIARELLSWIGESEDLFVFRRLALTGKGEYFKGSSAANLFSAYLDRIREMAGDPEWAARYFSLKILLADQDPRSLRGVRELFHDSHPLIRKTIIQEFEPEEGNEEDQEFFFKYLTAMLCDDTAFEVRKAAKERLLKSFPGRYQLNPADLNPVQTLHVLEQFDTSNSDDRSNALNLIGNKNLEIRFGAARFLQDAGVLESILLEADFDDREVLNRNRKVLENAVTVSVTAFLDKIHGCTKPASLQLAAVLLKKAGNPELISQLLHKVFALDKKTLDTPEGVSLFTAALEAARERGTASSAAVLVSELKKRCSEDGTQAALILDHLAGKFPSLEVPVLLELLEADSCSSREQLHNAFLRCDSSFFLPKLLSILKSERDRYPHEVRISALLLLGKLKLPYCMQFLLEQMPVLPFEEARDFSLHLKEYAGTLFEEHVLEALKKDDGKVRAALICAVPATGIKGFLGPIRDAVGDADPEVRRAAVWALLEYGDQKSIKASIDLLRDPVERVRMETARALGSRGSETIISSFEEILSDENEVEAVKIAAIEGLGRSETVKSVDLLVRFMKKQREVLSEEVITALSMKRSPKQVRALVEKLKDADADLRDAIFSAFRRMGEHGEQALLELLSERISSLASGISSVLEATGFVEHTIRKLNHRDPEVRKEAAKNLSLIGTTAAFRGIVLASRDPDQEVRVMVTKALEVLGTKSGKEILEELKKDPDRKIRKYTLWALERIEAKGEV